MAKKSSAGRADLPVGQDARQRVPTKGGTSSTSSHEKSSASSVEKEIQGRRGSRPSRLIDTHVISDDGLREINRFFKADHAVIIPLTVKEILDEQIARKLA